MGTSFTTAPPLPCAVRRPNPHHPVHTWEKLHAAASSPVHPRRRDGRDSALGRLLEPIELVGILAQPGVPDRPLDCSHILPPRTRPRISEEHKYLVNIHLRFPDTPQEFTVSAPTVRRRIANHPGGNWVEADRRQETIEVPSVRDQLRIGPPLPQRSNHPAPRVETARDPLMPGPHRPAQRDRTTPTCDVMMVRHQKPCRDLQPVMLLHDRFCIRRELRPGRPDVHVRHIHS